MSHTLSGLARKFEQFTGGSKISEIREFVNWAIEGGNHMEVHYESDPFETSKVIRVTGPTFDSPLEFWSDGARGANLL